MVREEEAAKGAFAAQRDGYPVTLTLISLTNKTFL